jgi:phage tail-like protein
MPTIPGIIPLHVFRFKVEVTDDVVANDGSKGGPQGKATEMCFAECTGLEATMESKPIKEGGRNYGTAQRAGAVTFATVVLKRGISEDRAMWKIFNGTSCGLFAPRLQVTITVLNGLMKPVLRWQLLHAMPVKFKFADLNAKGMDVGIEELHFVHEGLVAV